MSVRGVSMEADRDRAREYWVEIVRSAADRGKLEKIPTRIATTKRECAQRDAQNHWLSKKSVGGFHHNYELIDWSR